jgi:hypothetical protein
LLKDECGGAWRSYFQRGNWRMVFPFSRSMQEETAEQLAERLREGRLLVVHLVRFPQQTINHAMLLFDVSETEIAIAFQAYDPNQPGGAVPLTFDRASQTFSLPASNYFHGGRVDVYEIYRSWLY